MKNKLIKITKSISFYQFDELRNNFCWNKYLKLNEYLILLDHFTSYYPSSFITSLGSTYHGYSTFKNAFVFLEIKSNNVGIFDLNVVSQIEINNKYFKILT